MKRRRPVGSFVGKDFGEWSGGGGGGGGGQSRVKVCDGALAREASGQQREDGEQDRGERTVVRAEAESR